MTVNQTNSAGVAVSAGTAPASAGVFTPVSVFDQIAADLTTLTRAVTEQDARLVTRVMRMFPVFRKRLSLECVAPFVQAFIPEFAPHFPAPVSEAAPAKHAELTPVSRVYVMLLATVALMDAKAKTQAMEVSAAALATVESEMFTKIPESDALGAKTVYLFAVLAEQLDAAGRPAGNWGARLMVFYRRAAVRRRRGEQGVVLNALLRQLVGERRYDEAIDLLGGVASDAAALFGSRNGDWARYLFYAGKVEAVRLNYTQALQLLTQAGKKAPVCRESRSFRQTVAQHVLLVQLLMGDIPDRASFSQGGGPAMDKYLRLTETVRRGDVGKFQEELNKHLTEFEKEDTAELAARLHHNVIKAGLRKITTSYSKISINKVAEKLKLNAADEALGVAAKAIVDGVIEAFIDGASGSGSGSGGEAVLVSEWGEDVYASTKPQDQLLNKRVGFLLQLNEDLLKAMEFNAADKKPKLETIDDIRRREEEEEELFDADNFDDF